MVPGERRTRGVVTGDIPQVQSIFVQLVLNMYSPVLFSLVRVAYSSLAVVWFLLENGHEESHV